MENDLEDLFSEVGKPTEIFIPIDRISGQPRGFAFVTFAEDSEAAAAIEKFNGHELDGKKLRINEAEERAPRPGFGGGGGGTGGGGGGAGFGPNKFQKRSKPKGSRKNLRSRKRG